MTYETVPIFFRGLELVLMNLGFDAKNSSISRALSCSTNVVQR